MLRDHEVYLLAKKLSRVAAIEYFPFRKKNREEKITLNQSISKCEVKYSARAKHGKE